MVLQYFSANYYRLDGLVPNTPRDGSAKRANGTARRKFETPSTSKVKAEPASSPPEFKTPYKPGEHLGKVYVLAMLCTYLC